MKAYSIRRAGPGDVRPLIDLLGNAVPHCSTQTVWSVPWTWQAYSVLCVDDRLVAAGSLSEVGTGDVELRGLVVAPDHQGLGLAASIVRHLMTRATASGRRLVCITKSPEFFAKFGFRRTAPTWLEPQRRLGRGDRAPTQRVAMANVASL